MDYPDLIKSAGFIFDEFQTWATASSYETKGILHSEMLFLMAIVRMSPTGRIIESGRARGQSTLMLAQSFPEREIISIEYDRNSTDVAIAANRLMGRANVDLRFGDSRKLLPELIRPGDLVLIDGPKAYRAVRLAMRLLAMGKCAGIFVHDLYPGQPERSFVDRHFPSALFSDDVRWAGFGSQVDADILDHIPAEQRLEACRSGRGYGFSMTYIPYEAGRNYRMLELTAKLQEIGGKLKRVLRS